MPACLPQTWSIHSVFFFVFFLVFRSRWICCRLFAACLLAGFSFIFFFQNEFRFSFIHFYSWQFVFECHHFSNDDDDDDEHQWLCLSIWHLHKYISNTYTNRIRMIMTMTMMMKKEAAYRMKCFKLLIIIYIKMETTRVKRRCNQIWAYRNSGSISNNFHRAFFFFSFICSFAIMDNKIKLNYMIVA